MLITDSVGGGNLGLFTKYCDVCGKKIEKNQDIVRFGKHFDSENHANIYEQGIEARRLAKKKNSSSCCG